MSQGQYRVKVVTIDNATWTAITTPMACNALTIRNVGTVAVKLRTDSTDAATEKSVPAGAEQEIALGVEAKNQVTRFGRGDSVCFLQTASGTFDVPVDFVA